MRVIPIHCEAREPSPSIFRQKDTFVYDWQRDRAFLVSMNAAGTATGNDFSYDPVVSPDARVIQMDSGATDLDPNATDANGATDVYVVRRSDVLPQPAEDSLRREDYPDAQLLRDRMRMANSRWPLDDRIPSRVQELARRVEAYYESGENEKQPVL